MEDLAGYSTSTFTFPSGEKNLLKNLDFDEKVRILTFAVDRRLAALL